MFFFLRQNGLYDLLLLELFEKALSFRASITFKVLIYLMGLKFDSFCSDFGYSTFLWKEESKNKRLVNIVQAGKSIENGVSFVIKGKGHLGSFCSFTIE